MLKVQKGVTSPLHKDLYFVYKDFSSRGQQTTTPIQHASSLTDFIGSQLC